METERITLNQRERDRLRVLHEIKGQHISQIEAAQRLKISDRHIRRLLIRLGKLGDRAVLHGLRGRPSNRRGSDDHTGSIRTAEQQRVDVNDINAESERVCRSEL
jgi:hypothetical protein